VSGLDELPTALAELAAERPRRARRVRVGIDGDLVQVKLLSGLPRLSASRLDRAVALQAGRWFLKNGRPLITGTVMPYKSGRVLAAAVERDVLEAVADGVARAGLRTDRVGAAAGAVARLLPDGDHVLTGPDGSAWVSVHGHEVTGWRRAGGTADPLAVPGLGPDSARFFAAYAVAAARPSPDLALDRSDPERLRIWRRLAVRLAAGATVIWMAAAAVFTGRVTGAANQARAELQALGPALDAATAVERDLALSDQLLSQVDQARTAQSRDAEMLATLTHALPDSVHLTSVRRARDARVTVMGFAPSAARVVAILGRTAGVESPAIQGGLVRDGAGGRAVERFTLAFTWRPVLEPK
jgi:hypothetical protein